MSVPRAPRKPIVCVDHQLEHFEADLFDNIALGLGVNINVDYWAEIGEINTDVRAVLNEVVRTSVAGLCEQYAAVKPVVDLLDNLVILMVNVIWAGLNVHFPQDPVFHVQRIIGNATEVYMDVIYANLRTEMIMANHNASVMQRTWRRCVSDPGHPVCRRRLEYELEALTNGVM